MGECIPKGENRWRIRVFCRRDENGKKVYCFDKTLTVKSIKKRNSVIRAAETKHERGECHQTSEIVTLDQHLDKWFAHKKPHLEPNTFQDYVWNLAHYIRPKLGARDITTLRPLDFQDIYDEMVGRGLSGRSVAYLHTLISQAMEKAVWWELIPSNPTHRTERPSAKRSAIQILQPDEAAYFIQRAKTDRLGALFTFMLSNGPRPEEAFGLQWPHLDFDKGKVQIGQVLKWNRTGGGWRLRDYPKTDAGRRVLTLDPPVIAMLQDWRRRQLEERLQAGRSYENNDLVFSTPTGEPLYPTNVLRRHFRPLVIGSGLNPKLRVYDLRHTFATLSLLAGVDVKKLSYDMGHTRTSFTMDTYCHIVEQMHLVAAGKLESILWPKAAEG